MAETVDYAPFETTTAGPVEPAAPRPSRAEELSRLHDVSVELAVEVGRTQMTIREALALGPGSIVTLNRLAGEPVDLLVNGKPIARGEVVVIDEEFGLRVTEVLAPEGAPTRPTALSGLTAVASYAGITGGVHRAARAVASFWRKAYEDGLTGLAAMVAYNLLLSIFPLALISLFVAGRVLRSPELAASVIADARTIFPTAAESTLRRRHPAPAGGLDDGRHRRARLLAVGRRLLLGRARHRVLPHLPPAVPHVGAPEAVRLRDARGRAGLHRGQRRGADRAGAAGLGRRGPAVRARRHARPRLLGTIGLGLVVLFGALCITYFAVPKGVIPWSCVWPGALGATIATGLVDAIFPRLPDATSRRCGSAPARCSC